MTLKSMTGFARRDGTSGPATWHWEVRSVNGRGLDVRLRFSPGYEALEPKVREAAGKELTRGSVSVSLSVGRQTAQSEIRLNEGALAQVIKAAERIRELTGGEPARPEGLLSLKGVLEVADESDTPEAVEAAHAAILVSFTDALAGLVAARSAEGARLAEVIADQLIEIERLVTAVEVSPARTPDAINKRLKELVGRLLEADNGFDPARLHQEAVLLATRADVEEELRRLRMHIAAARDLLTEPGAVGRKFDFLAQEFNREANTLCSKANDPDITRAGLALKVVIDQMREQVQNLE
ncbi:MAG: YicC/YloC family endoribonuclease [Hyphomicrobiaceae bacterium]|nr:YicC/YloC family endoribonuclease [Hyphomicrobiaceae bacterium]